MKSAAEKGSIRPDIKAGAKSGRAPLIKEKAGKMNEKKNGNAKKIAMEKKGKGKNEKNVREGKGNTSEANVDQQAPQQQPEQQHQRGIGGSGAGAN
jgi:hypothetical protein